MTWRTARYDDPKEDLLHSDLDRMEFREKGITEEPVLGRSTV